MCVLTFWGLVRPRDTGKGRGRAWGMGAEVDPRQKRPERRWWGGSRGLRRRPRWQGAGPQPTTHSHGCHGAGQQPVSHCPQEAKGERGPVRGPQPSLCSSQSLTRQKPGTPEPRESQPGNRVSDLSPCRPLPIPALGPEGWVPDPWLSHSTAVPGKGRWGACCSGSR